jgi:hypothetical protein
MNPETPSALTPSKGPIPPYASGTPAGFCMKFSRGAGTTGPYWRKTPAKIAATKNARTRLVLLIILYLLK